VKLGLLLLTLLVSSAAWAGPQGKRQDAEAHINRGLELRDSGDLEGSITEYREAIRLDPKNEKAHQYLGVALSWKGDWDGLIAEEREALGLNPKNVRARGYLGAALGAKGDYDEAIAEEREAIRLNPDDGELHYYLGEILKGKGDFEGAIAEYREAGRLDPKDADSHVGIGDALRQWKKDWNGAIKEYREALRLNPKNAVAHQYLGEALGAKHDYHGEIVEERESLRLDPNNKNALRAQQAAEESLQEIHKGNISLVLIFGYFALIGLGVGLFYFIKGFLIFREFRVFEDTPKIPIRGIAMGLTHVQGKSEGEQTVPGPISNHPCFFYEVRIEKWHTDSKGKGGHWAHLATDADGVRFYLTDNTGKVLVDPHGAECRLFESASHVISIPGSADEKKLDAYVVRVAPGHGSGVYRLMEQSLLPNLLYDVIGTCVENSQAIDEHDRNLIVKGQTEKTFLISCWSEKVVKGALRKKAERCVFGGAGLIITFGGILIFLVTCLYQ
jgi:tetratricopeptide (TPR) repeat protein